MVKDALILEVIVKNYNRARLEKNNILFSQMFFTKISNIKNNYIFEYITEKASYRVLQFSFNDIKNIEIGSFTIVIELYNGYILEIDAGSFLE